MQDDNLSIHDAVYRTELNHHYSDNPLIEAMPACLDEKNFNQHIREEGGLTNALKSMPSIDALDAIDRLKDVFYPLSLTYQLYEHIYVQMRRAYGPRNPLSAEQRRIINQLSQQLKAPQSIAVKQVSGCKTVAPTILVSGEAGVGKSASIKRTLRLFKQVLKHHYYHGELLNTIQVQWLSFDMQATNAKKDFARNFFRELDRVTGTNTTQEFLKSGITYEQMQNAIRLATVKYNIGIIHIDEVQFALNRKKGDKDTPSFPELESLFNKIGVPLILSTTPEALQRFEMLPQESETQRSAGQTSRRLASVAHIKLKQWKLSDRQTQLFFSKHFPASLFDTYPTIDNEFKKTLMILSAGVPDAMSQLAIAFLRNWYKLSLREGQHDWHRLLGKVYVAKLGVWHAALSKLRATYKVGNLPSKSQPRTERTSNVSPESEEALWEEVKRAKPSFNTRPRTTKHRHKAASKVERIDEGGEVIDAESIIVSYQSGQCDV